MVPLYGAIGSDANGMSTTQSFDDPSDNASYRTPGMRPIRMSRISAIGALAFLLILLGLNVISNKSGSSLVLSADLTAAPPTSAAAESAATTLSKRGESVQAVRDDIPMFMAGAADPYDPIGNTDGYLVMLVAENKLMYPELAAKLLDVQASEDLPQWVFNYGDLTGEARFKQSMANLMKHWILAPIAADHIVLQAGAGSVLAQLSYLLGDPGDAVLVTGPNYPAFASDFGTFGQLILYIAPTQADNNFAPTVEELESAYQTAVADGYPPKILIICQPNNPTGVIYSKETMELMITWALSKDDMHVVSDEIYALSVFPGESTTSAANVMYELHIAADETHYLTDRVHIVAGLSKDWGMSGFRVGSLFSHNDDLLQRLQLIGYYEAVSQYTQHALTTVFEDEAWVTWFIGENQKRLHETFVSLKVALDQVDIPLVGDTKGGLFAWADLSSLLKENQTAKELWIELFQDAKVLFTLGDSCNTEKVGMFRIVYPWPIGGPVAMEELGRRLSKFKANR